MVSSSDEESSYVEKTSLKDESQSISLRSHINVAVILSVQFFAVCSDTLLFPFFPKIADEKGMTHTEIGVVFSSFDLSRFIASPVWGSLLVDWGAKRMSTFGGILCALSSLSFGTTYYINNTTLFCLSCVFIRICSGCGFAMLSVSSTSIILKSAPYKTGTTVAMVEMVEGAALAFGPALGVGIYELVGYSPMFWIFGGIKLCVLVLFVLLVPSVEDTAKESKNFLSLMQIPGCIIMFAHCTILRITSSNQKTGITNWLISQFHVSVGTIGILFGVWPLVYIVSCLGTARAVNKGCTFSLLTIGWILSVILWLTIGPSPLLNFIFHGKRYFWLTVINRTLSQPVQSIMFLPVVPAILQLAELNGYKKDSLHTYGMVTGMVGCAFSLGSSVGPTLGGAITDALNFAWLGTVLAGVNSVMFIVMATYSAHAMLSRMQRKESFVIKNDSTEKPPIEERNFQLVHAQPSTDQLKDD